MQGSELPAGLSPTGFTPYPGKGIPGELPRGVPAGLTLGNPGKLIAVGMLSFRVGMEFRDGGRETGELRFRTRLDLGSVGKRVFPFSLDEGLGWEQDP